MTTLADFHATGIAGDDVDLARFAGQLVLVVNTASHCKYTSQLDGLQQLYRTYHDRGLEVLGFPCNQFGAQEPGTEGEIAAFCLDEHGVTFPMFAKVDVNGPDAHPLWRWMRANGPGVLDDRIKWNFCKFLIGTDGQVLRRYASGIPPMSLAADIEAHLPR